MPIAWIIREKLSLLRRIRKAKVNKWANYFLKSHLNAHTISRYFFYFFHHISITNPEFWIYQFYIDIFLPFLISIENFHLVKQINKKIIKKLVDSEFRIGCRHVHILWKQFQEFPTPNMHKYFTNQNKYWFCTVTKF